MHTCACSFLDDLDRVTQPHYQPSDGSCSGVAVCALLNIAMAQMTC